MESGLVAMARYEILVVHNDPVMQEDTLLHYKCDTLVQVAKRETDLQTFHGKCNYSYVILMNAGPTHAILGSEDQ